MTFINEAYKVLIEDKNLSFVRKDYFLRMWNTSSILLEEQDNKIIGVLIYLIYKVNNKRFYGEKGDVQIKEMAVRKDFHRKGIGTKLIKKAIDLAKEYYANNIVLAVRKDNPTAISFYEKNGFMFKRDIMWQEKGKPLPGVILSLEV